MSILAPSEQTKLARVFAALGDDTRLSIINRLKDPSGPCVSEIAHELGLSPSAISQQFRILEMNNIVKRQRQGQKICYRLNRDDKFVSKLVKLMEGQK